MPRHPRLFLPGATYHVYCRVARGEFVFDDDFEGIEFVEVCSESGTSMPRSQAGADKSTNVNVTPKQSSYDFPLSGEFPALDQRANRNRLDRWAWHPTENGSLSLAGSLWGMRY